NLIGCRLPGSDNHLVRSNTIERAACWPLAGPPCQILQQSRRRSRLASVGPPRSFPAAATAVPSYSLPATQVPSSPAHEQFQSPFQRRLGRLLAPQILSS